MTQIDQCLNPYLMKILEILDMGIVKDTKMLSE